MSARTVPWTRLTDVVAVVSFKCICRADHEVDFAGAECDGATSVQWACDDCGAALLVYVDVDARARGRNDDPTDR